MAAETRAVIRDVICPAGDDVILEVIGQTGKTGIDCPSAGRMPSLILSPPTAPGTSHSSPMAWGQDGADRLPCAAQMPSCTTSCAWYR